MRKLNNRGFALLATLVLFDILLGSMLVASKASNVVNKSVQFFKGSSVKNSMNVIKAYLVANAADPENDNVFELLKDATGGSGGALPASLPVNTNDEYGTAYRYCNWDTGVANTANAAYSQNTVGAPGGGVIGQVISAGKDRSLQTACGAASASGDDILVNVHDSDVKFSIGGIGGWSDNGSSVTLLNPMDNVGLGVLNPTHKLELAAGTTPAAGIALGDVEMYRSGVNTLSLSNGNSLNLASGNLQVAGVTVIDSSSNITGNNLTLGGGAINLNNGTSNMVIYGAAGLAPPSTVARSAGTKVVFWPVVGGGSTDYAMGVDTGTLWTSVADATKAFKWYGGNTVAMALSGAGDLTVGSSGANVITLRGQVLLNDSSAVATLRLGGDVDIFRGAANRMDLAAGDSLNLASGSFMIGGLPVVDSTRQLNNVAGVATPLVPSVTNTYDLGSPANQYRNIYAQNIYAGGNSVLTTANVAGTVGAVPKFTGANTLGNSNIVDNGGLIGIGKTSLSYLLDVNGTVNATAFFLNGSPMGTITAGNTVGQTLYWDGATWQRNSGLFFDPVTGFVGIGTTSPRGKLDVVGIDGTSANEYTAFSVAGTSDPQRRIVMSYSAAADAGVIASVHTGTGWKNTLINPVSGNVGIGTTNPASKLTVSGGDVQVESGMGRFKGWYNAGTGLAAEIGISSGEGYVIAYNRSTSTYATLNIQSGSSNFKLNPNGVSSYTGGNFGFGTTDPTAYMSGTKGLAIYDASFPGISFGNSTKYHLFYSNGSSFRLWDSVNGERMVWDSTGDVILGKGGTSYRAYYSTGSASYSSSMNWYGLQLGNNSYNYIVAGRTQPGGAFRFYVNNTSDFPSINGTLALTLDSNGYVRTPGWFTLDASGTGIYSSVYGNHFYSNNGYYWKMDGAGLGAGGLVFYQNYESNLRGYVYWDTASFGLLDNSGNWRFRLGNNGTNASMTYGGAALYGSGGGYSGFSFHDTAGTYYGTLMMNGGARGGVDGFYDENRGYWRWYVDANGSMVTSAPGINYYGGSPIYGAVYN